VLGGDAQYQEFAKRWGSSEFGSYVNLLRAQADEALLTASEVSPRYKVCGRQSHL
jgi:thiaminase